MKFKEHDVLLTNNDEIILVIGICVMEYVVRYKDNFYCINKDTIEKHCVKIGVL